MARLRPFLVQATYDWIIQHSFTPYLLVDAEYPGVEVPGEYVDEGRIVLNISPMAVRNLQIEPEYLGFEASFSGESWNVYVPTGAVLAIYSRENSQGIYARDEGGLGMLVNEGEDGENPDPLAGLESEDDQEGLSHSGDSKKVESIAVRRAKSKLRVVK